MSRLAALRRRWSAATLSGALALAAGAAQAQPEIPAYMDVIVGARCRRRHRPRGRTCSTRSPASSPTAPWARPSSAADI